MTNLKTADAIYLGSSQADKVYLGSNVAWEPGSGGTFTTLNPLDKYSRINLSGGDLIASANAASAGIVRSVAAITEKVYFEGVLTNQGSGTGALAACGVATSAHALSASLGYANPQGWAFWGNNVGARHNSVTAVAIAAGNGAVLGFAVDATAGTMWIRKSDGTWLQGDPAAGTSPIWSNLTGALYAAACPWNSGSIVTMRFDPESFSFAAPAGFSPLTG